ncbi:MAG: hypothetical protein ACQPRH_05560 [Solitalea-like symbiont of Tyrophagus putrescentiae]
MISKSKFGIWWSLYNTLSALVQIILAILIIYFIYKWINKVVKNGLTINKYSVSLLVFTVIGIAIFIFVNMLELTVNVDNVSIKYRLYPIQNEYTTIEKNNIKTITIYDRDISHVHIGIDSRTDFILKGTTIISLETDNSDKTITLTMDTNKHDLYEKLKSYGYNVISR